MGFVFIAIVSTHRYTAVLGNEQWTVTVQKVNSGLK